MSENDHVHVWNREPIWRHGMPFRRCGVCNQDAPADWADAYSQCERDIIAHGLSDHADRLEWACDDTWDGVSLSLRLVRQVVWAYRAWKQKEE